MPPLPDAPRCVKVQLFGTFGPANWANVFYMQYPATAPTTLQLTALAAEVLDAYGDLVSPRHVGTHHVTQVVCTDVGSRTGAQGDASSDRAGGNVGISLPANVAMCATKLIARRYRGGHPRMYLCGIEQGDKASETQWNTGKVALWDTALEDWLARINGYVPPGLAALKMVNVSYWTHATYKGPPVLKPVPDIDLVTGIKIDSRIDSQRRRLS